ncbi:unnamed protein product [Lasius platythorax]|uniref:Uncharacterized protein n=1 Tax=Lasius platythorax TaxID=488582 RepID=A0AAV2NDY8_9HYME
MVPQTVPLGHRVQSQGYLSGLTPVTGALLERTVISLGTRGNKMGDNNKNQQAEKNGPHAQQAALDTSVEMRRVQAWDQLEQLITNLQSFIEEKTNVHGEIQSTVTSMGSAFKRLKDLEKTCAAYYRPVTTTVVAQTLPSHPRTYFETMKKTPRWMTMRHQR